MNHGMMGVNTPVLVYLDREESTGVYQSKSFILFSPVLHMHLNVSP